MKKLESLNSFLNNESPEKQIFKIKCDALDTKVGCVQTIGFRTRAFCSASENNNYNDSGKIIGKMYQMYFYSITKKIFILLLLSGLNIQQAYCQMSEKLKMHYSLINKAEMAIIDSNYQLAINLYDSAFAYKDSPFAVDIYNAAICASLTLQYDITLLYLKKIIDKAYKINNLQNKKVLSKFFESKFGDSLVNYSQNIVLTQNVELRHVLDSLYYIDQFFRRKVTNHYEVYGDTIEKIDMSNTKFLLQLINHYGFPSEDLIGVSDSQLTRQPYYIPILHAQQRYSSKKTKYNFSEVILKALYDGEIMPQEAAILLDSEGKASYEVILSGLLKIVLDTCGLISEEEIDNISWGYFNFPEESIKEINERRLEIGLEILADQMKKMIFKENDSIFNFSKIQSGMTIFMIENKEDYDYMKANLILIK